MKSSIDIDRRNPDDMILFLEARVEALSNRVQELERENAALLRERNDPNAHLGAGRE